MTGIERLRTLAGAWDEWGLGGTLAEIADQIERELQEERDRWDDDLSEAEVSWNAVAGVCLDMERHVSGVEGAEDSPVARWARELRAALGGDRRDRAADVSVSAYDLLPQEERDAITWVREHGGLDAVKRRWECLSYYADPVPRSCMEKRLARLQRQIDESHAALRRRNQRIEELGRRVGDLTTENAELQKRLMPEGYEWPRYESGELVQIGDDVTKYVGGGTIKVRSVEFLENMTYLHERFKTDQIAIVRPGERIAVPSVLAADLDSWERIEEDKGLNPFDYCKKVGHKLWTFDNAEEFKASDLVRRAKKLAGVDND